jgi:hypothetical protein
MFKFLKWQVVTEAEVQAVISNVFKTAASVAQSQVDTSKPLTDYERGRRDAASDILLLS